MASPSSIYEVETSSGGFVNLLEPDPATINLEDIAAGLGRTCRYGGQLKAGAAHYSVAEHCVLVHDLLRSDFERNEVVLAGLLHDAPEAYLGDVLRPEKEALREVEWRTLTRATAGGVAPERPGRFRGAYDELTFRMEQAITQALQLPPGCRWGLDTVATCDMWAMRIEALVVMHSGGEGWRWDGVPCAVGLPPDVRKPRLLGPDDASQLWLDAVGEYLPGASA